MDCFDEIIAAIATPPGEGALAIVRLSGEGSLALAAKLFRSKQKFDHAKVIFGKIVDGDEIVDEVLLLPMLDGKSFTGEESVEIFCHGGHLIPKQILALFIQHGARVATPGEFSFRAFKNGKIDLAQAESIQSLIGAQNAFAKKAATLQLQGALSKKVEALQKKLADLTAIIEAWVDYPEEGLEFATPEEMLFDLRKIESELQALLDSFSYGEKLKTGYRLALIGAPNAGKSSLMNLLLGKDRAIVTPIAGTTRDLLEESLLLGGHHFHLTDTAGIRESEEPIEKEGIRRSKESAKAADLILLVIDRSKALEKEEKELLASLPKEKLVIVWNKSDLGREAEKIDGFSQVEISALTGQKLDLLHALILEKIESKKHHALGEILLTEARHAAAVKDALFHLHRVIDEFESTSPEFLAADLRNALLSLGQIIGIDVTEEILSSIFSKFCVGK